MKGLQMAWFLDFFFQGWAEMLSMLAIVAAAIWIIWVLRYNQE